MQIIFIKAKVTSRERLSWTLHMFFMKILSVFRLAKFAVSSDLNLDSGHLDSEQVGYRLQRKIFGCKEEPFGPIFQAYRACFHRQYCPYMPIVDRF